MKILPRENTGPLCLIAKNSGNEKPISVISFGIYWRWEDVTEAFLPKEPTFDENWYFTLSRNSSLVTAGSTNRVTRDDRTYFTRGAEEGQLVWRGDHFTFTKTDYPNYFLSGVREIPPMYLGGVKLEDRDAVIDYCKEYRGLFSQRDGWLYFPNDTEKISATAPFWIKMLKRIDSDPYFFIHMAKPLSPGAMPDESQTYVLERKGGKWINHTRMLIQDDLSLHYRPLITDFVQAGSWKKIDSGKSDDDRTWDFGTREFDLEWNHSVFTKRPARRGVFTSYGY